MAGIKMDTRCILLIDDDETLLELLGDHIRVAGYSCLIATSGREGLRLTFEEQPDLVVLDIMMPGMDGWDVCQQIREESDIPIIMLTAKGEEFDKLRGFHLGVDDYVTKPFSFAELVARINAVLARARRTSAVKDLVVSDDLTIDFEKHRVFVDNISVELTPTEYRLLETLAQHRNYTVPTEQLLHIVWGPEYEGQLDQVKHYIWSLRKKIERDPGDPRHILTERGFGYRLE
jgi:DNA-binding response OmpR family regulator